MSIAPESATEATWARVEDDFYVGSRNGQFLGYVEREEGGAFVARNMYSQVVGEYPTLNEARRAVDGAPAPHEPQKVGN